MQTQEAYVLTAKDRRKIAAARAQLEELVEGKGAVVRSREMSGARFSDYVDYRGLTGFLLGALGVFYVGMTGAFAYVWLRLKKPEIHVLNLLGYAHTRRKVWVEYSTAWLAAFCLNLGMLCVTFREPYDSMAPVFSVPFALLLVALAGGACANRST